MGRHLSSHALVGLVVAIVFTNLAMATSEVTYGSEWHRCPLICSGHDRHGWTTYHSLERLSLCDEPMLFDFAIHAPLDALETTVKFRACTATNLSTGEADNLEPAMSRTLAMPMPGHTVLDAANLAWWSPGGVGTEQNASAAFETIQNQLHNVIESDQDVIIFAHLGNTVIGLYMGAKIEKISAISVLAPQLTDRPDMIGASKSIIQICDEAHSSDHTLGIAISTKHDLVAIQNFVQSWSRAKCVSTDHSTGTGILAGLNIRAQSNQPEHVGVRHAFARVHSRGECRIIKAVSGDSCGSLAAKCGVSGPNFEKYNSYNKKLCSTLVVGQPVCCSPGTLPDLRPKPKPNGECATYTIKNRDTCADIAASNGLKGTQLDEFNKETWGWNGCQTLFVGQAICLSKGSPPLPAPVSNAVCGPTKPGTKKPPAGVDFATLNPCPLKACCNIWGSCGTTKDFCTISKSATGNPGTSRRGENGCISNCGMDIVNNEKAPDGFKKIAYYESWNLDRPCMRMDVRTVADMDQGYTHLHFAFVNITKDLKISVNDPHGQFENFKALSGIKRVAAFGGWSFSVGADSYTTFREAVKPENRDFFANQVVQFVKSNNLDGVDFDWEYPGATDLPIPSGSPDDPANYLKLLQLVRKKLPTGMTLSIAAPASYWYLKAFPIAEIAETVDYIVYMTYDLHGQWDFGSHWASDGCPKGGCLRSHVNMTETLNALSMITKAGVEARKIVVGIATYGRSFKMTDPKCKGPMCTFVGPLSAAAKGECTQTSGYISNAEISDIMDDGDAHSVQAWYDEKTDSDYLIYNETEWVAYMSKSVKDSRTKKYRDLNFGGVSNWAVDLEDWWPDRYDVDGTEKDDTDGLDGLFDTCDDTYGSLEDIPKYMGGRCSSFYLVTLLSSDLSRALEAYREVSDGYDDKFNWYVDWVIEGIDPLLEVFMLQDRDGNKYMDCTWRTMNNQGSGPCTEMRLDVAGPHMGPRIIEYRLRDEEGFYEALLRQHSIEKEWVTWGDYARNDPCLPCFPPSLSGCPLCLNDYAMYKNFPRRISDTSKIEVPNPKKLVDASILKMNELAELMASTIPLLRMGNLDADDDDPALAFSMPIFMLADSIESIKTVKEIGEEQKKAKTRELVLGIFEIVFSIIPFLGEAGTALGGAAFLARAAGFIAKIGSGALTIVEIVNDPLSAPFAVLELLMGGLGIKSQGPRKGFRSAADARRALDEDKLKLFSPEFRRKDELVRQILQRSRSCAV
ncbi:hypothetical protein Trco_001940 [Trichoderma cornu-damae]|uniref:chitinase n=1 Tax=Trichoderma cornu-damae TaxID=654480 RepID=A0A9P8QNX1_9HYPO|nr:hypothetical protein Trco_001940 [Trichoderma cornu-damae]